MSSNSRQDRRRLRLGRGPLPPEGARGVPVPPRLRQGETERRVHRLARDRKNPPGHRPGAPGLHARLHRPLRAGRGYRRRPRRGQGGGALHGRNEEVQDARPPRRGRARVSRHRLARGRPLLPARQRPLRVRQHGGHQQPRIQGLGQRVRRQQGAGRRHPRPRLRQMHDRPHGGPQLQDEAQGPGPEGQQRQMKLKMKPAARPSGR